MQRPLKNRTMVIRLSILIFLAFTVYSCENEKAGEKGAFICPMKCESDKAYVDEGFCPVCKMDLVQIQDPSLLETGISDEILETSIFNLTSKWRTQDADEIELKELRGDVLVVVMIYTTCKAACPRLVADMRNIHSAVDNNTIKYILVSIDPENDTPERLKEFAKENKMDNEQWTFLQGTKEDVREFSNVLGMKYKKTSPIDFSHSNIISVFNKEGVLQHQQEGLGVDNSEIVMKILELTDKPDA